MPRFLVLLALSLSFTLAAELRILLPASPGAPEKTAAEQLAKYLPLLSGEPLQVSILSEDDPAAQEASPAETIYLGRTERALAALDVPSWDSLQPDEILYRVDDKGTLWIAGEGTRGTLYAVFEVLEREYGARFFTADCEYLPRTRGVLALPAPGTAYRYAPPFISRVAYYHTILAGKPDFIVKMRNNFWTIPEEWGGNDNIIGFVHTMERFIPDSHFAEHPEWFSYRDGFRDAGSMSQLCLTNQEMRQELIRRVLEELRKDGGKSHFISVSQNDNQRYCLCPECTAFVEAHGNQTDLLLDCVNQVAEAVEKEFPKVYVDTLAYNYTRQPPKTVRPRKNVAIRYCTIEARSFFPLESPQNQNLYQEMQEWKQVAEKMLIWNYVTDFIRYYLPHPNWHTLAQDTRLFRDCNAINVFQQGAYNACGPAADLGDLRAYLLSRLLWNPDADDQALVEEFCRHFYGPATPYVKTYLDGVTALAQFHPEAQDNCYPDNTRSWMSDEDLASLWEQVYAGVRALAEDPVYGPRMEMAALPITMDLLDRQELLLPSPEERLAPLRDVDPVALCDWCRKVMQRGGVEFLNENHTLSVKGWADRLRGTFNRTLVLPDVPLATKLPAGLPAGQKAWSWNVEDLGGLPYASSIRTIMLSDDPAADGGKAITMPNTHREWFLQMRNLPRGVFDVYLSVRCDLKPGHAAQGVAMTFGNYPDGPEALNTATADRLAGPEYKLIYLGRSNLNRANYFYGAPAINLNVERIWIDQLVVTNPTDDLGNPLAPPEEE
ncbi:MAG: DUF4838 domain-containing protein [Oligosphaeraceae bacterium]